MAIGNNIYVPEMYTNTYICSAGHQFHGYQLRQWLSLQTQRIYIQPLCSQEFSSLQKNVSSFSTPHLNN